MHWDFTTRCTCIPASSPNFAHLRERWEYRIAATIDAYPNPDAPDTATCPQGARIPTALKSNRPMLPAATHGGRIHAFGHRCGQSVHGFGQTPTTKIAARRRVAGGRGRRRTRKGVGVHTSRAIWTAKWTALDDPWTTRHPLEALILLGFGRLGRLGRPLLFLELKKGRLPACGQREDIGRKGRGADGRRKGKARRESRPGRIMEDDLLT